MNAERLVVGLTGGIGSGKSTVAEMFARRGATLVDTDVIAHQLTAPGAAAMPALRAAFGDGMVNPDGSMNRGEMRRRVFADPSLRQELEAILHPLIRAESLRQCEAATGPYVLLIVPLLIESGDFSKRVSRVLVVDCPEALQIERVMTRSGLSESEARSIMKAQVPRAARLAAADDVIANDRELASVDAAVAALHRHYVELAAELKASC